MHGTQGEVVPCEWKGSMQKSVGNWFIIGMALEANEVFEKPLKKQDKYQAEQQVTPTIVLKATFLAQKDDASSFLLKN